MKNSQDYSKEDLNFFNERRNAFFAGNKEGYTVEELHGKIRRNYNNGL